MQQKKTIREVYTEELRPYFESYTLDVIERNRFTNEYLELCRKLLEQPDITIVPSVSPDELTLVGNDESVLFDPAVPEDIPLIYVFTYEKNEIKTTQDYAFIRGRLMTFEQME